MSTCEQLHGTIEKILFSNSETGYAVFTLRVTSSLIATATGMVPAIAVGQKVKLHGIWTIHPKFGKQFTIDSCSIDLPSSALGLKKYLGSGLIRGIGKHFAEKLVDHFGTEILKIIDADPERLRDLPGIGPARIQSIKEAWLEHKAISAIMVFLQDKGISATYATKIFKKYGNESIALLNENPYRLAYDIWGIGFKLADKIANNMGFEPTSTQRAKAGILYAISRAVDDGHLYVEVNELKQATCKLLDLNLDEHAKLIKYALHALHHEEKIKVLSYDAKHYITLSGYYYSEHGCAMRLRTILEHDSGIFCNPTDIYNHLRENTSKSHALNEEQQRGIMACLQNKITIVTGGPGTGKTTLIRQLLDVADINGISYQLAAPTGRAAKRMQEGTGRHAMTLHRLLDFDPSSMSFRQNEHNALKTKLLIVDEASMIDIFLAHAVSKALPLNAHLVLIGDIDQLPSVGAGNVLRDLISSNKITTIQLRHIFRQAQNSMIVVNAHRVNAGEFPTTRIPESRKDFLFVRENDPSHIMNHIERIYRSEIKRHHITPEQTQVLVPMNRGSVGTQVLNMHVQELLNPPRGTTVAYAGSTFHEGDRVMQIKNNYDKHVFNGDMGYIESIDPEDQSLIVRFYDTLLVTYERNDLDELVLSYAITIHKSQGSEYDAVIIPIFTQHYALLQRNLIYTAITRAKKLCILVGQTKAIAMAVKKLNQQKRITFLRVMLSEDVECR
ncbi:ATP-dependent RecD-like DNA helicase [Candidatus Babeliales bacterium]|nr:ATP-dependent RecD-like DNA helicase [Candidatus Babeliales bacterium]